MHFKIVGNYYFNIYNSKILLFKKKLMFTTKIVRMPTILECMFTISEMHDFLPWNSDFFSILHLERRERISL